jgi:hypothetical protein
VHKTVDIAIARTAFVVGRGSAIGGAGGASVAWAIATAAAVVPAGGRAWEKPPGHDLLGNGFDRVIE